MTFFANIILKVLWKPMVKLRKLSQNYYASDLKKLYLNLAGNNYKRYIIDPDYKISKIINTNIVILDNSIGHVKDVQYLLENIYKALPAKSKLIITYYNHLWEPVLRIASFLGLRKKTGEQNWLDNEDIKNLLNIAGFEIITSQRRMLIPIQMGFLSEFINNYIAHLPLINSFCLTTYVVASKNETEAKDFSVSIILPARNEAGNISQIVRSIPSFGKFQEIIFVEGGSNDDTWEQIQLVKNKIHVKNKKILSFKQKRKGKADAVRLGFSKSSGEILMIYDSDRTVSAHDLPKFYNVLKLGSGEFANGSRLVYPMEKDAMRILNKIGNNIFGSIFTWILGQRFKDTLCGTKAFFKSDYLKFKSFPDDPFGDFELIFGAIRNNLKVIEIPVRYKERVYGSTNIHRFKHGLLLLKMTWLGFKEFKAF